MFKSLIQTLFIVFTTLVVCFFTNANEIQSKTYLTLISLIVIFFNISVEALKDTKTDFRFLTELLTLIFIFIIFYIFNSIEYLFIPCYLYILYSNIVGNMNSFRKKVYIEESNKEKRKEKIENLKKQRHLSRGVEKIYNERKNRRSLYVYRG